MRKDVSGQWIAPLPFRSPRQRLPNNRALAVKPSRILHSSFERNPVKKQLLLDFMSKIIDKGHAEVAPLLLADEECWYLPVFWCFSPEKAEPNTRSF